TSFGDVAVDRHRGVFVALARCSPVALFHFRRLPRGGRVVGPPGPLLSVGPGGLLLRAAVEHPRLVAADLACAGLLLGGAVVAAGPLVPVPRVLRARAVLGRELAGYDDGLAAFNLAPRQTPDHRRLPVRRCAERVPEFREVAEPGDSAAGPQRLAIAGGH